MDGLDINEQYLEDTLGSAEKAGWNFWLGRKRVMPFDMCRADVLPRMVLVVHSMLVRYRYNQGGPDSCNFYRASRFSAHFKVNAILAGVLTSSSLHFDM